MCKWLLIGMMCVVHLHAQNWISDFRKADEARDNGFYMEAVELYSRVLALTYDTTAWIDCLNSRAYCYKKSGDYHSALIDYGHAERLTDALDLKNRILFNKTEVLLQTGRYEEVSVLLSEMKFENEEQEGKRIANLAVAYSYMGDFKKGLELLDKLIGDISETGTKASLLQNRGFIKWEIRDYEAAYEDFREALPLLHGERYYLALANLAIVESELNKYDEALSHIDAVMDWQCNHLSFGVRHPDYIISLRKKAEIVMKKGDLKEALRLFGLFYESEKDYVKRNFIGMTEQNRLDFWKKEKPLLSEIFTLGDISPEFLYDVALLRRHIALLDKNDVVDRMSLDEACDIDSHQVMKALQQNEAAVEFVCYEDFLSSDTMYIALVATSKQVRYVPLGTRAELHGYQVGSVKLDEAVCAGSHFVDEIYTDSLLARKIWQPIFNVISSEVRNVYFSPDGLFQMLGIEYLPYCRLEEVNIRRLSSTSHILSLQEKNAEKNGNDTFLIIGGLDYSENMLKHDTSINPNLIAYDYVLDNYGKKMNFRYLQGSSTEAENISSLLGTVKTTVADEAWLKCIMGKKRVIHLATHGYSLKVSFDEPLYFMRDSIQEDMSLLSSGIALTGANVAGEMKCSEDGLLSARELCDLNLTETEFVVLSACQTAQGVVSDEGPAGVVRGLKRAGVKSIIATLWSVDDKATAIFMNAFYNSWLLHKQSMHVALREAQETLYNYKITTKTVLNRRPFRREEIDCSDNPIYPYRSPYYWAPFILID